MRIETDKIYCGDSLQVLQTLPENAVDCCVTSPPYYALRDYGADGQIGREATPEEYVSRITAVFHTRLSPFYGSMPHTALWEAASSSRRSAAFLLP